MQLSKGEIILFWQVCT